MTPGRTTRRSRSTDAQSGPSLKSKRLVLRPLSDDDAQALHRISNEPTVRRYLRDDNPVGKATIHGLISRSVQMFSEEGIGLFGVRMHGSENFIGFCGFARLECMEEPELGFELTKEAWRQVIATEAAVACLRHAFEKVGLERVIAGADAENVASLRVLDKLGMVFVGRMNPNALEEPYFAIDRKEFRTDTERSE